jgi:hypothetical protein
MLNYRRILFALSLFTASVFLLVNSSLPGNLEGLNLDGSSSITWRSVLGLLFVLGVCERLADWSLRRKKSFPVLLGTALCVCICFWLLSSFQWEPHQRDGTFPLTWRTNLLILAVVAGSQSLSFAGSRIGQLGTRSSISGSKR